ncbi:MAG: type II toxin-antitoxin system HigB family toxin [Chloroflexi bacterium]|nr:MAG: type II toxin-antitoxin system HigB family toxin [Chloroflexota bacterium]
MHVISKSAWRTFVRLHPDSEKSLDTWHRMARAHSWQNLLQVRETFRHADVVGRYTIFNVGGNKYRLIVEINYKRQVIYIRDILTHQEYDTWTP